MRTHIEDAGNAERLLWNHAMIKLVHKDGKVTGAIFETDNGNVQINARKGVVLATGGYPANPEMVQALSPIVPQCVVAPGYSPKDLGDGIKAGIWAGGHKDAEAAPMVFNRGVVAPGVDCGYQQGKQRLMFPGTVSQLNLGSQPFMKVSREGTRFANESCPYDFICFAAAQHEGGVWAQIFDANMVEDVMRFATAGCSKITQLSLAGNPNIDEVYKDYLDNGLMFKADTVEELADKLGFAGDAKQAFLDEVERYNGFFDAQADEDFYKEPYRLSQIRTAPFYGAWYGGTLLTTCDGLSINEEMQVLDDAQAPIEGLYAIGDCSGSYFSGNYPEYLIGAALGRTLTQGRHVVRKLAGEI